VAGRVTDAVFWPGLVTAAWSDPAFIYLDQVTDAFEHPLDSAIAARLALFIVDGGYEHILRSHLVGRFQRPYFQAHRMRIKIGEIAGTDRLGVGWDYVAKWQ